MHYSCTGSVQLYTVDPEISLFQTHTLLTIVVRGCLFENYIYMKFVARNICNAKYSQITVIYAPLSYNDAVIISQNMKVTCTCAVICSCVWTYMYMYVCALYLYFCSKRPSGKNISTASCNTAQVVGREL